MTNEVTKQSFQSVWLPLFIAAALGVFLSFQDYSFERLLHIIIAVNVAALWGACLFQAYAGAWFSAVAKKLLALCLLILVVVISASIAHFKSEKYFAAQKQIKDETLVYEAIVLDQKPTLKGDVRLSLQIDKCQNHVNMWKLCDFRMFLYLKSAALQIGIGVGDEIRFRTKVHPFIHRNRAGVFDPLLYAFSQKVHGSAQISSKIDALVVQKQKKVYYFAEVREHLRQFFTTVLTRREAGVVLALLIGETALFEEEQLQSYRNVGAGHLLAVSGLQVSLLALLFYYFISRFLLLFALFHEVLAMRIAVLMSTCMIVYYVLLCDAPPSCVRAGLMSVYLLFAAFVLRKSHLFDAFFVSAFCSLLFWPESIFDPGYLLSYAAVFGLILSQYQKTTKQRVGLKLVVIEMLKTTFAAYTMTFSLSAYLFGQVADFSLLVNLFLLPIAGLLQVPTLLLAPLAYLWDSQVLAQMSAFPAAILESITLGMEPFFGGLTYYIVADLKILTFVMFVSGLLVALVCQPIFRRKTLKLMISVCTEVLTRNIKLVIFPGFAYLIYYIVMNSYVVDNKVLLLDVLPVGQGDGMLIRFPNSKVMLVDAGGTLLGGNQPGKQVVLPFLRQHRISKIDVIVLSHPHPDHVLGILDLIPEFDVGEIWHPGYSAQHLWMKDLNKLVRSYGIVMRKAVDLDRERVWGDVKISILAPFPENRDVLYDELGENDNSLVFQLTYGEKSCLLTGDIEGWGEYYLLKSMAKQKIDVLKAGHHGSKTSSTQEFVDRVGAENVIFSTGRHNQFHFPNPKVIQRWRKSGSQLWDTGIQGQLHIEISKKSVEIFPFWQREVGSHDRRFFFNAQIK